MKLLYKEILKTVTFKYNFNLVSILGHFPGLCMQPSFSWLQPVSSLCLHKSTSFPFSYTVYKYTIHYITFEDLENFFFIQNKQPLQKRYVTLPGHNHGNHNESIPCLPVTLFYLFNDRYCLKGNNHKIFYCDSMMTVLQKSSLGPNSDIIIGLKRCSKRKPYLELTLEPTLCH